MKKVGDTMKKLIITLSKVLIILIVITFLLTTYTNASDIVSSMAGYEFHGNNGEIRTMGQKVIGVIQVIGVAISVIMLVVLAVRFMLAAPDGKAEVKKQLTLFVIGAFIFFGATTLLNIVASIGYQINLRA